jgi:NitT/TauT family transport system substrate-binding protein
MSGSHFSGCGYQRRDFLRGASSLGAAALLGLPAPVSAEPPPETKKIRLLHAPAMCLAPQYIAEDLLRAEGFAEVEYVPVRAPSGAYTRVWLDAMLVEGVADFSMGGTPGHLSAVDASMDANDGLVMLAGIHAGCYELFGNNRVQSIRDLKGKTVAVTQNGDDRLFISSMMAYVGIDPTRDTNWVTTPEPKRLFVEGKVDAFLAFPPEPQKLRAEKIGRVFLSTTNDRPWSQYFCCTVAGNREFVRKHPVATKRVLRAYLKAADICANDPQRAARYMVDKGYMQEFKYALEIVTELPYRRWREAEPEDTVRFYALRLQEVGLIKSSPQKIIAQGTDWRYLNELKKELKA